MQVSQNFTDKPRMWFYHRVIRVLTKMLNRMLNSHLLELYNRTFAKGWYHNLREKNRSNFSEVDVAPVKTDKDNKVEK